MFTVSESTNQTAAPWTDAATWAAEVETATAELTQALQSSDAANAQWRHHAKQFRARLTALTRILNAETQKSNRAGRKSSAKAEQAAPSQGLFTQIQRVIDDVRALRERSAGRADFLSKELAPELAAVREAEAALTAALDEYQELQDATT